MNDELTQTFASRVITDLAAAYAGVLTNIGHKLGLYRAMAGRGPVNAEQLAKATGTGSRYVREWLSAQVVGGYIDYNPESDTFTFPDEHAEILANDESPLFLAPAFDGASSMWLDEQKALQAFQTGQGLPWGEHDHRLFHATEALYRNGYRQNLTNEWIPAMEGVAAKLRQGGTVADIGCGHGVSTILIAQAFPKADVVGLDIHEASIEVARRRAQQAHATSVRFEVADVLNLSAGGFDFVCFMDSFHDLGDPLGAASRVYDALDDDGTLMLVEPFAADRLQDNQGPIARLYYSASTTMCTANALHQGDMALGAQAGPARLEEVLRGAGFSRVRVACETPFNIVIEARK